MLTKLKKLEAAAQQALDSCADADALEALRVQYLGKKGELTALLKELQSVDADQRPVVGAEANRIKVELGEAIRAKTESMDRQRRQQQLESDSIEDVTLPSGLIMPGAIHPLTQVTHRIVEIFHGLGYAVADGPQIETDYYNFSALNFPDNHPARDMQDTFFVENGLLLRTHTSPVQIHVMERRRPPLKIIVPGAVYRHDDDITHSPIFYQVEGLAVDESITMADLKGTLRRFVVEMFGDNTPMRLRPSFFPFTEPSAEVDMGCPNCCGKAKAKGCRLCGDSGWLEILGAGMVDPAVLENVDYDPERYQGFAFGIGVERIAMILYGIDDIRLFYDGALPFLEQFA